MNYETIRNLDLTAPVALYSTSIRPAGSADAGGDRPWGVPQGLSPEGTRARTEALAKVIEGIGRLLDVLQPAHRGGTLLPGDIQQMQRLEIWYSELQAEQEHVSILKAPPTVNT
jgi:hypothetical protein